MGDKIAETHSSAIADLNRQSSLAIVLTLHAGYPSGFEDHGKAGLRANPWRVMKLWANSTEPPTPIV